MLLRKRLGIDTGIAPNSLLLGDNAKGFGLSKSTVLDAENNC
ncbi:MAG: hypothetical protein OXE94_02415 [Aestuariivita sp.]|nr:hypothetical protein [Aestuariivita sp.]MCY4201804.1 hypothetical protein [Aestuariivita sp.]MCY4289108.1 hypothetical protein [Aestuariivita sp.]MCY4347708.1 hypothetical protein [Aestuariivita sp.]